MSWYVLAKSMKEFENYDEMFDWFKKRTNKHISAVQKYCEKIEKKHKEFKGLVEQAKKHDSSKFMSPEIEPYIFTTWRYKCKDEGKDFDVPEDIEEKMTAATIHHVLNNSHHPESSCGRKENLINEENRDLPPDEIVNGKNMTNLDVAEMVADWCAVSDERGNSPKEWADKNIGKRWSFSDEQKKIIYDLIESVFEN